MTAGGPPAPAIAGSTKAKDNARFYIWFGSLVLASVFGGIATWSVVGPIDGAVIATATLQVESNRKAVQHLEGGIVGEILVREGDTVRTGDILIRLDDTVARANLAIIDSQLDELLARRARLIAERDGLQTIGFPTALTARDDGPHVQEIIDGQRRHFVARRQTRNAQLDLLTQRARRLEDKIAGLQAQRASKLRQIELLERELVGLRDLHAKGFAPLTRILALEREAERLAGERGAHTAEIAEARNAIGEAEMQMLQVAKDFRTSVIGELRDAQVRIAELSERRIAARDQLRRIDILAPRDGTVLGLTVHTVGGVIAPGEPIMHVVPDGDRLLVAARVLPQDIDNIRIGSQTVIRLSAFSQRRTPEVVGQVETVAADSLADEVTGEPYYLALIALPDTLPPAFDDLTLVPGMPAETFIKTGERSAMSYLLKPLLDSLQRAFREE